MTRHTPEEFDSLFQEVAPAFSLLINRGKARVRHWTVENVFPLKESLLLTLFWLAHYPTLSMIKIFFDIHERTITKILKKTIIGIAQILRNEICWPTDKEFKQKKQDFCFFQNIEFEHAVCVVDGTEIRIARPSKEPTQTRTWSGKKKQNSLNVMFITYLNGVIIYFSAVRVGAHDQSHWNELHLRDRFIGKNFGIMGDGGFTFNRKADTVQIHGYKPIKSPKTPEEKLYNKKLSQMRVVVENSIRRVKQWKVLQGVYWHWRDGKGQIPINDLLTVVVVLSNRKILKCPPRQGDWVSPEWREIFESLNEDE